MVGFSDNSRIIAVYWPDEKTPKDSLLANTDRERDIMLQNKTRMLEGPLLFSSKRDENQKRAFILCFRPLGMLFFTMRYILAGPQS